MSDPNDVRLVPLTRGDIEALLKGARYTEVCPWRCLGCGRGLTEGHRRDCLEAARVAAAWAKLAGHHLTVADVADVIDPDAGADPIQKIAARANLIARLRALGDAHE